MSDKSINEYLAHLLVQANRQVNRQLSLEGVSLEQWRALKVISEQAGLTMRELARSLAQNNPTLTKIIDKMVSEALVYRLPDQEDRRKVRLFISDKGKSVLQQQDERVADHQGKMEDVYGAAQTQQLKAMLELLIAQGGDAE